MLYFLKLWLELKPAVGACCSGPSVHLKMFWANGSHRSRSLCSTTYLTCASQRSNQGFKSKPHTIICRLRGYKQVYNYEFSDSIAVLSPCSESSRPVHSVNRNYFCWFFSRMLLNTCRLQQQLMRKSRRKAWMTLANWSKTLCMGKQQARIFLAWSAPSR